MNQKGDFFMSKSGRTSGKDVSKSDRKSSNGILAAMGIGIIAAVGGLTALGSNAVLNSMADTAMAEEYDVRDAIEAQKQAEWESEMDILRQEALDKQAEIDDLTNRYTTDQIEWMQDAHITWNEDGNPINEYGKYVDDPTTAVDEERRALDLEEERRRAEEEPVIEDEPETEAETEETHWWDDNPLIELDEDGKPIHIIRRGETLSEVASATGFSVEELKTINGYTDPATQFVTGNTLRFPDHDPTQEPTLSWEQVGLG